LDSHYLCFSFIDRNKFEAWQEQFNFGWRTAL
jgi:hypothetical protein